VATEFGRFEFVKLLIQNYKADPDARCGITGYTPLMYACQNGNYELVEYFLKIGCDTSI